MLPKEKLTVRQYFQKLQALASRKPEGAAQLVQAVLYLWQKQAYPALAPKCPSTARELVKNSLVVEFSGWLAQRDILTSAFWLSSAYAHWVGAGVRTQRAMFFTPPRLSSRLIDDLVTQGASLTKHVWMDPASGGAAFLAPVALRMSAELRSRHKSSKQILEHVSTHLKGNDIDPFLAGLSKQFLRMALSKEIADSGLEPKFTVTTSDALHGIKGHAGQVDVVICNPPYRKMPASEVAGYCSDYQEVITGQPNLYALFFKLVLGLLKPCGIAGLLTPTSYLSGRYFSPLRTYLLTHARVRQFDIIPALGTFVGVDQETAISVFSRLNDGDEPKNLTTVFAPEKVGGFREVGSCSLPNSGAAWPIPRSKGDVAILLAASRAPFRLKDYGYVVRVGAFVWNRDTRKTYSKFTKLKNSVLFPLIWSSDIAPNGGFALGRLRSPGAAGKYVNMGLTAHGSVIHRPGVALQRVTSTDQHRRLIGSAIPEELLSEFGGVVGENHVVFLEQAAAEVEISPTQLALVLQSEVLDRLFRCISGAVNVSKFELDQLPLPNPVDLRRALAAHSSVDKAVAAAFANINN